MMARRLRRYILPALPRSIIGVLVICLGCFSATAVAAPSRTWATPFPSASREAHLNRILSVLEKRMPSHAVSERARAKLLTLSDGQVRIAASLADRIGEDGHTAVAETAFLLLTVLIILS